MPSSHRSTKWLAALLGVALLGLVAIPVTADANIHEDYYLDDMFDSGRWILSIQGDENSQRIVVGCSGGEETVNGQFFPLKSVGRNLRCNEPGSIRVDGGGGNDQISVAGVSATSGYTGLDFNHFEFPLEVFGGSGVDTLTGGPFSERFNGGGSNVNDVGADTVRAGGGNDEVFGTRFGDRLYGGAGKDVISPDKGDDFADGGSGHDGIQDVQFGNDDDRFFGGPGPDQLFSGGGNDVLDGGTGADWMDGQGGKDLMLGRDGGDALLGSGGADRLFGHAGNDYLRGGPGKDKLVGGPGKDDIRQ